MIQHFSNNPRAGRIDKSNPVIEIANPNAETTYDLRVHVRFSCKIKTPHMIRGEYAGDIRISEDGYISVRNLSPFETRSVDLKK